VVLFVWRRESQKRTLPCPARRGFAFEPNAVGELAHQRRGEKSSNPRADWNTPLKGKYSSPKENLRGQSRWCSFCGGERAKREHCLARQGEGSHSPPEDRQARLSGAGRANLPIRARIGIPLSRRDFRNKQKVPRGCLP